MGRVFTINFSFEEKQSGALVCMYEKDDGTLFRIHVYNEDLYRILPSGDLEYSFTEGLRRPKPLTHQKAALLVKSITDQILHFLMVEEQSGR